MIFWPKFQVFRFNLSADYLHFIFQNPALLYFFFETVCSSKLILAILKNNFVTTLVILAAKVFAFVTFNSNMRLTVSYFLKETRKQVTVGKLFEKGFDSKLIKKILKIIALLGFYS